MTIAADAVRAVGTPHFCRDRPTTVQAEKPLMVMRDDTDYCVRKLAQRIATDSSMARGSLCAVLARAYRLLQAEVRSEVRVHAKPGRTPEFQLIRHDGLAHAVRSRANGSPTVTLDPLVQGDLSLQLSRGYRLGQHEPLGLVPRPCRPAIDDQVAALAQALRGSGCVLVEDDVYTGETITTVFDILRRADIRVVRVVPGIHVDSGFRLASRIPLDPVLRYHDPGGMVDVADPRNFLLGVSGLVVRLPPNEWCRAPYWLPFVRTSRRITIDDGRDHEFALAMIAANARFYARVEADLNTVIRVRHLTRPVQRLLTSSGIATMAGPVQEALRTLRSTLVGMRPAVSWPGTAQP